MGRIVFWFRFIGAVAVFIGMAFVAYNLTHAQTPPDITMALDKTEIKPGEDVNVSLNNLQIGKTYTLAVASTDGKRIFHTIAINVQKDPKTGTCVVPKAGDTFEEGDGSNGWCRLGIDFDYFIKMNTETYNCSKYGDDGRCQIRLLLANKDVITPQYLKVDTPANAPSTGNGTSAPNVTLQVSPNSVYLGQQTIATLSKIPLLGDCSGNPCTYNFLIEDQNGVGGSGQPYARLDLAVQRSSDGYGCKVTTGGNYGSAWKQTQLPLNTNSYPPCLKGSDGLIVAAFAIDTAQLGFNPKLSAFTYSVHILFNGKEIDPAKPLRAQFVVKNELHLKFETTPRDAQTQDNIVDVEEFTAFKSLAIGCAEGKVKFQYWNEPNGYACAQDANCKDAPFDTEEVDVDTTNATATHSFSSGVWGLSNYGSRDGQIGLYSSDLNGDGVDEIGARATCESTGATATGKINDYKAGVIAMTMTATIVGYDDGGYVGQEKVPILDPDQAMKYTIYGLTNSPDCYYTELYRDGLSLKRPDNYPNPSDCQTNNYLGINADKPTIDNPELVYQVFDGGGPKHPASYFDIPLFGATATGSAQPLIDGHYELRLYKANGAQLSKFCFGVKLFASPCTEHNDSFVTSVKFIVGPANGVQAPFPPCKTAFTYDFSKTQGQPGYQIPTPIPVPSNLDYEGQVKWFNDNKIVGCSQVATAFGDISTNPAQFVASLMGVLLSISGGIALLLIIRAGYEMMSSRGDPEKIGEARERLTSAIVGLLFIIFSLVILEIVGVNILKIPGLCGDNDTTCLQKYAAPGSPVPSSVPDQAPVNPGPRTQK